MVELRKIVNVFLASPGDVAEERKAAKRAVDEVNHLIVNLGYQIDLVGWEDTPSRFGRPQDIINPEVDRCQYFLGVLSKRWGTPPGAEPYTSGFEEEFRRSVDRREREKGVPEISLFFKEIPPDFLGEDQPIGVRKVLEFKRDLKEKHILRFDDFSETSQFEARVRRNLWDYVWNLFLQDKDSTIGPSQSGRATTSTGSAPLTKERGGGPFSPEGDRFLREVILKTEAGSGAEPLTAIDVARFRLLGTLVHEEGNDPTVVDVHDANLLFTAGEERDFGPSERRGLVNAGFEHYSVENVPLWRWVVSPPFELKYLGVHSLAGTATKRTGALQGMRLTRQRLLLGGAIDRQHYLDSWFSDASPEELKVAALGYIADCGTDADLPTIRAEWEKKNYHTTSVAVDAMLRINLRTSREKAIRVLYELQPPSISVALLHTLFEPDDSVTDEVLVDGIADQNPDIRRITVRLLRTREALSVELAMKLSEDSDAGVRFEGLAALLAADQAMPDNLAKDILIKPESPRGLAAGGWTGLFGIAPPIKDYRHWHRYRRLQARRRSLQELEEEARNEAILDMEAAFVLADRQFQVRGNGLRHSIDDLYESQFEQLVASASPDSVQTLRRLEEGVRKELTRKALDVLCANGDVRDLARVRKTLLSRFVDGNRADMRFLRRFGEWEDIGLIVFLATRSGPGVSMLGMTTDEPRLRAGAEAVYALGRDRFDELVARPEVVPILPQVIALSSDSQFRKLDDQSIFVLLRSHVEAVRKSATLKTARAFPKRRISAILRDYTSETPFYYNVVHWLDFGISVSRELVAPAVQRIPKSPTGVEPGARFYI